MTRRRDTWESLANATVGFAVSWSLVGVLRASGLWDAPAWAVTGVFFLGSVARSYVLRRAFWAWEGR